MNTRSFNKVFSAVTLVFFLATPIGVFAQDVPGTTGPGLSPYADTFGTTNSVVTTASQTGLAPSASGCGPGGCGANAGSGLGALGGLFGAGGGQGLDSALGGLAIASMLGGGRGFGGGGFGGGGGGATGAVSQALTLAGALTGNMGLMLAGMITSMIGGLGGAGATPQRGAVDEGYVAPGQAGPYGAGYGAGGYSPYYPTPTPAQATPTPVASCEKTIFIVKDTTVTPNTVRPYPTTVEISQNNCVLAINSDTSASHSVQVKDQGTVKATQSIDKEKSHIFRFENKKIYTLCVDAVAAACTTVTVK